jgi:hypothetical protein
MYLPLTSIQDAWGVPSLELEEGNSSNGNKTPVVLSRMTNQPQNTQTQTQTQRNGNNHPTPTPTPTPIIANNLYAVSTDVKQHPNYISEPEPTRVDVALFDRTIVSTLYGMSPQNRTMYITEAVRNNNKAVNKQIEPMPMPMTVHDIEEEREYFKPQIQPLSRNTNEHIHDLKSVKDQQLWGMLMFVMIFILVDKLIGILKKS